MSLSIAGMGWVTPLGSDLGGVWERLIRGEEPAAEILRGEAGNKSYHVFRVPNSALADLPPHPRLRRASAISRFAAAAGLAALNNSGLKITGETAARIGLVFAIANGGVIYTKRFYHDIVASGADAASPLLFPETVFNAAASHLAAMIGITGTSYTLVGDGAVGQAAVRMAEDLLDHNGLDYCLVVGAEEADWLLCDAYRKWRLVRPMPPIEPFRHPPKGTILSEGAGAILLGRSGSIQIEATHAGAFYSSRHEAQRSLEQILTELDPGDGTSVICSANGTFVDLAESGAIGKILPHSMIYTPKPALGEAPGAGVLWQIIVAAHALHSGRLPPLLHVSRDSPLSVSALSPNETMSGQALVLTCGLNQQVGGLKLSI